ncbi:MAG: pyrimidine/purine nucleoside phosphorylase [Bacteroidales bacterium]|nr:pyrimidine/purine nucleoside phosphorylase [Bacteroidales bacterium]
MKTNEYFDGKVKSLAVENTEGIATVGVIVPGEYEFGTSTIEIMRVIFGSMDVQLPGSANWATYANGSTFRIEKGEKFKVRASMQVAYLCQYL